MAFGSLASPGAVWLWERHEPGLGCRGRGTAQEELCHFQGSSSIRQLLSSLALKDLSRDYGINPAFAPSRPLCLSLTSSENLLLGLQTH